MTSLWFVLLVVALVAAGGGVTLDGFRRAMHRIWDDEAEERVRRTRILWFPPRQGKTR